MPTLDHALYHAVLQLVTTGAGLGMNGGMVVQAIRIYRRRSSADVSLFLPVILGSGCLIWLLWGLERADQPLIVTNSFSVAVYAAGLGIILRYRRR